MRKSSAGRRGRRSCTGGIRPLRRWRRRKRNCSSDSWSACCTRPGDKDAIKAQAAREAETIQAQVDAYKEEHAIPAYRPQVICPLCGGAGYVRGILCTCIRRQAYQEVLGAQAVDSLDGSFAEFDDTIFGGQEEQRARTRAIARFLQNYALEFPRNAKRQLLFLGRAGLGKSFLLHALLKEIEPKEADICCISAGRLFDAFHQHRLGEDAGVRAVL